MSRSGTLRLFCLSLVLISWGALPSIAASPYPDSSTITGVSFNWATHIRLAPGSDNWPITWADDDNQYSAWGDGGGFGGTNSDGRVSLGFARIEGPKGGYTGYNVWGGKNPEHPATFGGKSYGIICVDGMLYAGVNDQATPAFDRVCKSTDHGATWSATSWSIPADERTITFLQFGKNYAGARDNYVYVYAPWDRWDVPGTEVWLARVPKTEIMTWASWEFYGGMSGGSPVWTSYSGRQSVFHDTRVCWAVSVSYNAGIGRYLLCNTHKNPETESGLGIFDAPEPWGPWTTVAYYDDWHGLSSTGSSFFYSFPNKWMSADGLNFVMIWTGTGDHDAWNTVEGSFTTVPPSPPDPATSPTPADGATKISVLPPMLGWTAGARAFSHDVYFGTANPPGPADFKGNQTAATFSPGMLDVHRTYYWRIDEVNNAGTTTGTVWRFTTRHGDHDGDGDVDQEDFGFFQKCLTGSGGMITPGCEEVDLDADEDVDVHDFGIWQNCMGGPDQPPAC
jgi:hypothetical protein